MISLPYVGSFQAPSSPRGVSVRGRDPIAVVVDLAVRGGDADAVVVDLSVAVS